MNSIFTVLTEKLMSKKKAAGSINQPLFSLNVLRASNYFTLGL